MSTPPRSRSPHFTSYITLSLFQSVLGEGMGFVCLVPTTSCPVMFALSANDVVPGGLVPFVGHRWTVAVHCLMSIRWVQDPVKKKKRGLFDVLCWHVSYRRLHRANVSKMFPKITILVSSQSKTMICFLLFCCRCYGGGAMFILESIWLDKNLCSTVLDINIFNSVLPVREILSHRFWVICIGSAQFQKCKNIIECHQIDLRSI